MGPESISRILNALDAMPRGGKLSISVSQSYSPSFLDVEIRDTGKGTGLGLSVSLGIVRKHGGAIRVQSGSGHHIPGSAPCLHRAR